MSEPRNIFNPDITVGNLRYTDKVFAPSALENAVAARKARLNGIEEREYTEISALDAVNVVDLGPVSDLSGGEQDGIFYFITGSGLNAASRRIINVKSPALDGDLASRDYVDGQLNSGGESLPGNRVKTADSISLVDSSTGKRVTAKIEDGNWKFETEN